MRYRSEELDILARAYHAAIDCVTLVGRDFEALKPALMRGLLDAADLGEWDEEKLKIRALRSIRQHHDSRPDVIMRGPL